MSRYYLYNRKKFKLKRGVLRVPCSITLRSYKKNMEKLNLEAKDFH